MRGSVRLGGLLLGTALVLVNALGWIYYGRGSGHGSTVEASGRASDATARIVAVLPTRDLLDAERLTIEFDAPLAATDAAPLPELGAAPFRIAPQLSGHWEWESPVALSFVLDERLVAGQRIEMTPTPALELLAGRRVEADVPLAWEAAGLQFLAVEPRSCDASHATLELSFNAPVDSEALASSLRITAHPQIVVRETASASGQAPPGPAPLEFQLLTRGAAQRHAVRFARPDFNKLLVTVDDLRPTSGPLGIRGRALHWVELPERFDIVGSWAWASERAAVATVELRFDRGLSSAQETPPATVTPSVESLSLRVRQDSLVLEGAFECGRDYRIEIGESLLSAQGETLGRTLTRTVSIPHRSPSIDMPNRDGILTPDGGLAVELTTTNVAAVRVLAHKLLPGNLVPHLRGERVGYTSRELVSSTYPLPLVPDAIQRHVLDLRAMFGHAPGGLRGIYAIEVRSAEDRWCAERALVRVTDLAPTVKRDADGVHVWVRSITSGLEIPGATVTALAVTDQVLATATTDAQGYAALPIRIPSWSERPYVVAVEHEGDLAYVELGRGTWSVPSELASGRPAPRAADVFLYTERRLYRPGDTVHVSGIARTAGGAVLTSPLRVVVERPDGRTVLDTEVEPELAQGVFHLDVPTGTDARTGDWQVRAQLPGESEVVGRARFGVEAFLAARLVITAGGPVEASAGAEASGSVPERAAHVRSLAGTSVERFPITATVRWSPATFESRRFPEFRFADERDARTPRTAEWSGTLDAQGKATPDSLGAQVLPAGRWRGRVEWTVTEPGGRSATTHSELEHDVSTLHLGLALESSASARSSAVVAASEPISVRWVSVDARDADVAAPRLGWRLEELTREPRLEAIDGQFAWTYRETTRVVASGLAFEPVGGVDASSGSFSLAPQRAALYRLSVQAEAGPLATLTFHSVEGDPAEFVPPAEELERVELTPLASPVLPGTEVELDVRAPFDGSLLVTLEDDRLRSQQRVAVVDGLARVRLAVPSDIRGGAFVSAQVTRPLDRRSDWRPHRAFGWLRLATDSTPHALAVELDAPKTLRPGARASVTVRLAGEPDGTRPALVHLFAVDEGLRASGGDRLPDPAGHFFAARRHSTPTWDVWSALLPDHELPPGVNRIGGDVDFAAGEARRAPPELVHRTPAIVWQRAIELDATRSRTFELDTPELVGTLTWIAVGIDGDRYGSAQASTLLRGELPLVASAPRFAAPGDRFVVPVTVDNTLDVPARVRMELELGGPATWVREVDAEGHELGLARPIEASARLVDARDGSDARDGRFPLGEEFELAAGASHRRWFELEATGTGRIEGAWTILATLPDGREITERAALDVPVRTGRAVVVAGLVKAIPAGVTEEFELGTELDLEGCDETGVAELELAASRDAGLAPMGRYLLEYPFGCAEQTASRIAALLALPTRNVADGASEDLAQAVRARVAAGIDRLWSMQASGGGLAYWPGATATSELATVCAAETLLACREAGHVLPPSFLDGLAQHFERQLSRSANPADQARAVRLLAQLDRPQAGWERRLMERRAELGRAGRVELAWACALAGRADDARALLATQPGEDRSEDSEPGATHHLLHSPLRTLAAELHARLALDPFDSELPRIVDELSQVGASGHHANTVDNAAALLALARYRDACEATPSDWSGTLTLGDQPRSVSSGERLELTLRPSDRVKLETSGSGRVWISARTAGRRAAHLPALDAGLTVRRRWLDLDGKPIDPARVALGTLVQVELSLHSDLPHPPSDVAIVDALPGGFEIENPRLANTAAGEPRGGTRELRAERVEFLDDRVLVFATAPASARTLRYLVRAVSIGTFEHAPPLAEAMYEPTTMSVGGPVTQVTVVP